MYFPGDPLFPFDPIFNSVTDEKARARMISSFDLDNTMPDWALVLPLRHRAARPRADAASTYGQSTDMSRRSRPSQTVGPFFAYGLAPHSRCDWEPNGSYDWKETVGANLVTPDATGEQIHIEGRVLDGDGKPINDAMIEIWQADAQGRYAHAAATKPRPNAKFTGFGRSATDKDGRLRLRHRQAGPGAGPGRQAAGAAYRGLHLLARHAAADLHAALFRRRGGQRRRSDPGAGAGRPPRHAHCPQGEPAADRPVYRFDIRVQGENETVFFDI